MRMPKILDNVWIISSNDKPEKVMVVRTYSKEKRVKVQTRNSTKHVELSRVFKTKLQALSHKRDDARKAYERSAEYFLKCCADVSAEAYIQEVYNQ